MANAPNSYSDPYYQKLTASTEQKLGLPVGLLASVVSNGERSNADQVSSAGAKTVFQIIPATRDAAIKKYGVDPYLNAENAAEVAGRLLQDSLKRNNNDPAAAVSEYIGGTNRDNWGPQTKAYTGRVMAGQQKSKIAALSDGFGKFMAQNPAAPAPAAPAEPAKPDALSAGFGDWLKDQNRPRGAAAIPLDPGAREQMDAEAAARGPVVEQTMVDKVIGAGEAGLTLATGATGGMVGTLGGAAKGLAGSVMDGTFGTQEGVQAIDKAAGEGAAALTYQPRTESGQQQAGAIGEGMAAILPAMPLTAEMAALGRGAVPAAAAGRDMAAAGAQRARVAAPAIAERVQRTLMRNPEPAPAPTPGTRGSGGSAGTDIATQRIQSADSLPVPIKLTEGQATRNPDQLRFELETAKGQQGRAIRDRYSDQNEQIQKNFDEWVDQTGKTTSDVTEAGRAADQVMRKGLERDKAEVNVKYRVADKSPEAQAAIDPGEVVSIGQGDNAIEHSIISYLNSKPSGLSTTALTDHAKQYAIKLGVAEKGADGELIAIPTNVKTMEALRKEISQATGFEPIAKRDSAILKGIIDAQTEPVAGPLYRDARRARENLAKKWENRAVVSDLVSNKRGMDDRKVAIEDVFKHVVLDSSRSELGHVRRVMQTGGEQGQQAWRELQGQTLEWIKSESLKNVATDQRGNRIVSAAQMDKAIAKLDKNGKLDFMFGKQGAQQLRDINELAKVVMTAPPGVVNTSNTASVLLAALTEAGITGSMTGLPVPVISGLRLIAKHIADKKLRARIEQSLNGPQRARQEPAPQP